MFLYDPEMTSIGLFAKPHICHVPEKLYRITMDHHFPRFSRSQYVPIDMPRMWCFPWTSTNSTNPSGLGAPPNDSTASHRGRLLDRNLRGRRIPDDKQNGIFEGVAAYVLFFSNFMILCFFFCIV